MTSLNTPLVSVVTIFLNEETFLKEAIESVLSQTYHNWELLLVDDGSSNGSSLIAREYAGKLPLKIRYLEHEGHQNRGMSASRNLGIRSGRGEYFTFLDADDAYKPDKLERQVALFEKHPDAMLVGGRSLWWYSWTGKHEDQSKDLLQKLNLPLDTIVRPPVVADLFLQDEWATLKDVMVRRVAVQAVGGYEDTFRDMYEDQVFHAKLCLAYPMYVSNESWNLYRQHDGACTSKSHAEGKTLAARERFLTWLEQYLWKEGKKGTSTWKLVRHSLRPFRHPALVRNVNRARRFLRRLRSILSSGMS